jgi:hypothetical protein
MEVVGVVVGAMVVPIGRVFCCCIYSKMKNTVKFQPNLDVFKKEMEGLLALRDGLKNEMEFAEQEEKVVRSQVIEWLKKVEELSQLSLNCIKRYRISKEATEKLKDMQGLLEARRSHSGAVAVNHRMPRAVERIPR